MHLLCKSIMITAIYINLETRSRKFFKKIASTEVLFATLPFEAPMNTHCTSEHLLPIGIVRRLSSDRHPHYLSPTALQGNTGTFSTQSLAVKGFT